MIKSEQTRLNSECLQVERNIDDVTITHKQIEVTTTPMQTHLARTYELCTQIFTIRRILQSQPKFACSSLLKQAFSVIVSRIEVLRTQESGQAPHMIRFLGLRKRNAFMSFVVHRSPRLHKEGECVGECASATLDLLDQTRKRGIKCAVLL